MGPKATHDGHPSGERRSPRDPEDEGEQDERHDLAEQDDLDPSEGKVPREREDGPGQYGQSLAELEDERDGLPRLSVPREQEPVGHGSEDDRQDRRENRGRQGGERERRPGPRLDRRGKA